MFTNYAVLMLKRLALSVALPLCIGEVLFAQGTQHDRRGTSTFDAITNIRSVTISGATPDVSVGSVFATNNVTPTTITNFLHGVDSQVITVVCGDTNTSIRAGRNIITLSGSNISCVFNQAQTFVYNAAQLKWLETRTANAGQLPNTEIGFSRTPSFAATRSASYSMTLSGNVTASTLTGIPANGNLLSFTLTEDSTGGRTFAFPGNFIFAPSFTFNTAANAINELTFKYDGTNWLLVSNAGGGSGTPSGNAGDLQAKQGTAVQTSGVNDDGTNFSVARNLAKLKGPNPYIDVTYYNLRALNRQPVTTGSITSGTHILRVANGADFQNNDGVSVLGAGPAITIATPSAPTVVASNAAGPLKSGQTVANSSGSTAYEYRIVARTRLKGYTAPSVATTITNGAATLGPITANVSSWTQNGKTVTVNTASAHGQVTSAWVTITGDTAIAGAHTITVTSGTQFTFTSSQTTANGAPSSGTTGGLVNGFAGNHISWSAVRNAWTYCIYGRTTGSNTLLGVSYPENTDSRVQSDPTYNTFDDWGSTYTTAATEAACPATVPSVAQNDSLSTTIASGGGTNTLTLAANASNTVAGARVAFDNSPNLVTAAAASTQNHAGQLGPLYFPCAQSGSGASYFFDTVADTAQNPRTLSVMQCGNIQLIDTMILGATVWMGFPRNPLQGSSFAYDHYPPIQGAAPMLLYANGKVTFSSVQIRGTAANGQTLVLEESNSGIPSNRWDNVAFNTIGSSDFTSSHLVERQGIQGAAVETFNYVNFIPGSPANGAPLFMRTRNGGVYVFNHVFTNRRSLFFGGGTQATFIDFYEQAANATSCKIMIGNFARVPGSVSIINSIEDTTYAPILCYYGGASGYVSITQSGGSGGGFPSVQGDGGMTVDFFGVGGATNNFGQNYASTFHSLSGFGIEGVSSTAVTWISQSRYNLSIALAPTASIFSQTSTPSAPTCSVSAGGSVAPATYTFQYAPVFLSKGEGPLSSASKSCTTTKGKQTVTVNFTPVTGAIGYDLYRNGFSLQCASPFLIGNSNTTFVWTNQPACGQSAPQLAGGGPNAIRAAGVDALQVSTTAAPVGNPSAYSSGFDAATGTEQHISNNNPASSFTGAWNCSNVAPVTVSANVSTDQNLMSCTIPAATMNRVGRALKIWTAGIYSTEAANASRITIKAKLCTVHGCGSGTVITLASITSGANGTGVTTLPFNSSAISTVHTAGTSAAFETHGQMAIDLTAAGAADSVYNDGNTATVGTIDSTAKLFLQITGTFSVAGVAGGNRLVQRQLLVETVN